MTKRSDDGWSKFNRLVGDALDIIEGAHPSHEVNKAAIISAMKLDKLLTAEKRASESLKLLIDLSTTPDAIQDALSASAANISTIDNLLAYNNQAYFNIIQAVNQELELNQVPGRL